MITFQTPKHHWNYFLAIEKDLENLSRYIEFANANLGTYSIELTHILLSASSEVDVIMRQLCHLLDPSQTANNINDYRNIIQNQLGTFVNEEICIDRFGISYKPWDNWNGTQNPDWWRSYNNVKHQRNNHFNEANLQNTINSVGALLLTVVYYYKIAFSGEAGNEIDFKETTRQLQPESSFMRINSNYYYHHLIV
ncbi:MULTISPECIES: hypothetical protein [Sphingobacterium]|uniref:hypothetical protein n=1 Tax=Sphingobacterium TaxID=28453 RepID=UPI00257E227D|nr:MULTISPECIES: hypothetical protein [Sphingobacterium]